MKNFVSVVAVLFVLVAHSADAGVGFFEQVNATIPAMTFEGLLLEIQTHGQRSRAYLSTGESHLEAESTFPIYSRIFAAFDAKRFPTRFCSEDISSSLDNPVFQSLASDATAVDIRQKNSPAFTDFATCASGRETRHVVHSGFYHQYPFARYFPEVFPQTRVITQSGNNIFEQMPRRHSGMLVSLVDYVYIEYLETLRVLKLALDDSAALTQAQATLFPAGDAIRARMELVSNDPDPVLKKRGILLDRRHFASVSRDVLPERGYLFLTDLEYRKNWPSFSFLKHLLGLSASAREKVLNLIRADRKKFWLGWSDLTARRDQEWWTMTVRDLDFDGELTFLSLLDGGSEILLTFEPRLNSFRCFRGLRTGALAEMECETAILSVN